MSVEVSTERMLRVSDMVRLSGWSRRKVIRLCERTPGVILLLEHPETMHKRGHRTFVCPLNVFQQIMAAQARRVGSVSTGPGPFKKKLC